MKNCTLKGLKHRSISPQPAARASFRNPISPDATALQDAMSAYKLLRLANRENKEFHKTKEAEAYLKPILTSLSRLTPDAIDPWLGKRIKTIIRKSPWFIVYMDEVGTIQWWSAYPIKESGLLSHVQAEVTRLEHETNFMFQHNDIHCVRDKRKLASLLRRSRRKGKAIRCLLGEALATALSNGSKEECNDILKQAEEKINLTKDQLCRPKFLQWALVPIALLALVYIAWNTRCLLGNLCFDSPPFPKAWHQAALMGAAGAFTSALFGRKENILEPNSGKWGISFDAMARVLIGAIAGVATLLAFDSGILLKEAIKEEGRKALSLLLCLVAGISERLLPSLVERAESIAGTSNKAE